MAIIACCLFFAAQAAQAISYSEDASEQLNATALRPLSDYIQTIYDDEDGLPGGEVNDIAQTKDGAIWIGTYSGLYRFNGKGIEAVDAGNAVTSVNFLFVDPQDRLWIGTNDGGVTVYEHDRVIATINEKSGLPSNSVRSIICDSMGNYYVGTTGALAVLKFDKNELILSTTIEEAPYTHSLSVNSQNLVAAVTDQGSLFLVQDGRMVGQVASPIQDGHFNCASFSPSGKLGTGISNKIVIFTLDGTNASEDKRVECTGRTDINSLYYSPRNRLFICSYNGISYLDIEGGYHQLDTGTFTSSIGYALVDYQGNVWFTSARQGLLKLSVSPFTEVYAQAGIPEKVVNSIVKWQGLLFAGTDAGIDVISQDKKGMPTPSWAKSLADTRIRSLMVDSKNNLWVCTSGKGAWCVYPSGSYRVFDDKAGATGANARSALELSDGTIALAGDNGISIIRDGAVISTARQKDGLDNPKVLCMYQAPDGTFMAGTDGNGIAVVKDGTVTKVLTEADGLSSKIILRMIKDPKGEGCFVVTSNGLCYLDKDLKAKKLDNFPYHNNYDIICGVDNELFVLSSAGIYVVNRDQLLGGGSLYYTLLDRKAGLRTGLTSNSWNYLDSNNDLYLCGDNGVSEINIADFDEEPITYLMDVRPISADSKEYPVKPGETTVIPRSAQRVVITPEVMNYTANDPYVSVQLKGFDAEPQVKLLSELNESVYTNLTPGTYTYRIAVLDANKNVLTQNDYTIVKEKVLYDEPWFKIFMLIVFAAIVALIVWVFVRYRMKKTLEEKQRELEIAQEQIEMANQAIITIARTVDAKDANTSEHSFRVSEYSSMIARRLGLNDEEVEEVRRTALLHDIGKVGIPESILNKPGKLTDEEYGVMKTHPDIGSKILSKFTSVSHIIDGARYHHERWDGKGYPEGLAGEDIPFMARIIGTADAFDAMTATRVYRKKLDLDEVLAELKRCRGSQFDPTMLDTLLELIDDGTIDVEEMFAESQANPEDRVNA